jgi:hypothetical protein
MLTRRSDGQTRWQHAVETAMGLVNSSAPSTEFRVADTSGRVDSGFTTDRRQIRNRIEQMQPTVAIARFPQLDEDTKDRTAVFFVTDGVVPVAAPANASKVSVFQPAENVGITAFEVRSTPSSPLAYEAYLEVHNYGKQTKQSAIIISGAGRQRIARDVQLQPGQVFREPFDLSRFEGGGIRATVQSSGDALALDDTAYAYLPVKRKTKVLLVTSGNRYLETMLSLDSLVELGVVAPSAYRPDPDFDVYVFDGFAPAEAPPRPALLVGGVPDVSWLPKGTKTLSKPKFDSWNEAHPVMHYVSLHDVSVESAKRIETTDGTVLAATADNSPLIVASPPAQRPRWVMLAFNVKASDFPLHNGFPLFVDNTLSWFSREPLALRRQPGLVEVPIANAQVKAIDGEVMPAQSQGGTTVFDAPQPGLYVASQEDTRQYVAVNLGSQQYSNVNRTAGDKNANSGPALGWLQQELWFYMLGAALVLITAEWFTYHRRITL